jgi:hypothetical protein
MECSLPFHCLWWGPGLGPPFDGEKISLTTSKSNTIDNMKTKIDNVKAKIRDEVDWGPWSRPTLARRHDSDQLAASPTSSPQGGSPDKSLPRTTSLHLARQVSASHDKSPPRTSSPRLRLVCGPWHATRAWGTNTSTVTRGERFPAPCKRTS